MTSPWLSNVMLPQISVISGDFSLLLKFPFCLPYLHLKMSYPFTYISERWFCLVCNSSLARASPVCSPHPHTYFKNGLPLFSISHSFWWEICPQVKLVRMCLSPCFPWRLFKSDYNIYRCSSLPCLRSLGFLDLHIILFTGHSASHEFFTYVFLSHFLRSSSRSPNTNMLGHLCCLPNFHFCWRCSFSFPKWAIFKLTCSLWAVSMPFWSPTQQTGLLQMTNSANVKLLLLIFLYPPIG